MLAFVDYLEQGWNRVVPQMFVVSRSEERRVGKEGRARWWP